MTTDREFIDTRAEPEPNSGCWLWMGARNAGGYGTVSHRSEWLAHRLAYRTHVGEIPEGLLVLHRCDTPPCVNPSHLWLGSNKDNSQDRERKGRHHEAGGEKCGRAKLTAHDVEEIRRLYDRGLTQCEIAERFNVTQPNIGYIVRGETWK